MSLWYSLNHISLMGAVMFWPAITALRAFHNRRVRNQYVARQSRLLEEWKAARKARRFAHHAGPRSV